MLVLHVFLAFIYAQTHLTLKCNPFSAIALTHIAFFIQFQRLTDATLHIVTGGMVGTAISTYQAYTFTHVWQIM